MKGFPLLIVWALLETSQLLSAEGRKNLLFIISDDLRALNAMGDRVNVDTPNLDAFTEMGVDFTRAYSACPMCGPARVSLMTGLHMHTHGVANNGASTGDALRFYPYLHQALKAEGYRTYGIGKVFHSGGYVPPGFDVLFKWKDDNITTPSAISHLNAAEANGQPFAMFVGLYQPHSPYVANYPFGGTHLPENIIFPPEPPGTNVDHGYRYGAFVEDNYIPATDEERRAEMAGYYDCVSWMDHNLGRILDEVDDPENTVIVFTGDHGISLREHNNYSNSKRLNIESNVRVPLVVYTPDCIPRKVDHVVSHVDIYSTLWDLLDLGETPVKTDGHSFAGLVEDYLALGHPGWAFSRVRLTDGRARGYRIATKNYCYAKFGQTKFGGVLHDPVSDPHGFYNWHQDPAYASVISDIQKLVPPTWLSYSNNVLRELSSPENYNYDDRDLDGIPNGAELRLGTIPYTYNDFSSHGLTWNRLEICRYLRPGESGTFYKSSDLKSWDLLQTFELGSEEDAFFSNPTNSSTEYFNFVPINE